MNPETLLETLLDRIGDGVLIVNREGTIASANRAAAEVLGYSPAGLIGLPYASLVLSEELTLVSADHARLWKEEPLPPRQRRFTRKDGTIVTARVDECLVPFGEPAEKCILTLLRDQTGNANAAETLHESQQQLRALFGNTEDAVYLKDLSGRYLTINPAGARLFDRPAIDILFRDDRFLFSATEADEIARLDQFVAEHGEIHSSEVEVSIRQERRALSTTRIPFYDRGGKVTGILGITRDTTPQRAVEKELEKVSRRYRTLIDANADGVVIIDLRGRIVELSERAAGMLGFPKEKLVETSLDALIPVPEFGPHAEAMDALAAGSRLERYECSLLRSNGVRLPVEIQAWSLPDTDGSPAQYQLLFRDLSGHRQMSQERTDLLERLRERTAQIQAAFEISASIASTLDLKTLLNQAVEVVRQRFAFYYVGIFLVEGGEAVLAAGSGRQGKQLLEAGHRLPIAPESMVGWALIHRRSRLASEAGKDLVRYANPLLPETRSELAIPLIVHGEPIGALTVQSEYPAAFTSEHISVLQIIADQLAITVVNARLHERLAAYAGDLEKSVLHRTAQLEILNKDLEAFSYSISHDLRAPLRAVSGYAGILAEDHAGGLSPQALDYVLKIRSSAGRMGAMLEDLLQFSKLGRQRLRKDRLAPEELVRDVLEDFASDIEGRSIEVQVDPLNPVHADRTLLRQVFANLISNAIKFTRVSAAPRIQVGAAETARGRAMFVADNGIGFDELAGERLFGVFQRLHTEAEYDGSGVGLAIVKRIIERHGGEDRKSVV